MYVRFTRDIEFNGIRFREGSVVDLVQELALRFVADGFASQSLIASQPSLVEVDYVESGLLLPASGSLTPILPSGVTKIGGLRRFIAATPLVLTATRDNYVDVADSGQVTVTAVVVSAAAPALAANNVRLGFITTGASAITGATTTGKDSLGNWMRNLSGQPACNLGGASSQSFAAAAAVVAFPANREVFDNDRMHDGVTNNSRITISKAGLYNLAGGVTTSAPVTFCVLAFRKNNANMGDQPAAILNGGFQGAVISANAVPLAAGDYIELHFDPTSGSHSLSNAWLSAVRVG